MQYKIKLNNVNDIKSFVRNMQLYDISMVITTLDGNKAINPKSIMGMFSLDLSYLILLTVHCEDTNILYAIKDDIQIYEI